MPKIEMSPSPASPESLIEEVRKKAIEVLDERIKEWILKRYKETAQQELNRLENSVRREIYATVHHDYYPDPNREGKTTYDVSSNLNFSFGVGYELEYNAEGYKYIGYHPRELSEDLFEKIKTGQNSEAVDELRRSLECKAILEEIERIKKSDFDEKRKKMELKILTDALAERRLASASATGQLGTLDNAIY